MVIDLFVNRGVFWNAAVTSKNGKKMCVKKCKNYEIF